MLDPVIGKLILRKISVDSAACSDALAQGVVKIEDLDVGNETHRDGVASWLQELEPFELRPIPAPWLKDLRQSQVLRLAHLMPEAKTLMAKYIRKDFSLDKLLWPEAMFPASWAEAVEHRLLEKPDWDTFHAVQDKLPADMTARLRKDLATKIAEAEKKAKEAKKAARGKVVPKTDALEQSILKRDERRLQKLPLQKLSKVRWEAFKDIWLKAPSEILAHAAKVPVEFIRPYEDKIVEAVAEQDWNTSMEWAITKDVFQKLDIKHQIVFLRRRFCSMGDSCAFHPIDPELDLTEIKNIVVAATLQDGANANVGRWLEALQTFRRLVSTRGGHLTEAEASQFRMVMPSEDHGIDGSNGWMSGENPDEYDDEFEPIELALELLSWVTKQPKDKQGAYGRLLSKSGLADFFGDALKAMPTK